MVNGSGSRQYRQKYFESPVLLKGQAVFIFKAILYITLKSLKNLMRIMLVSCVAVGVIPAEAVTLTALHTVILSSGSFPAAKKCNK